ncbi:Cu/Ag efflux pump CusA [Bradyrhizobium sp. USDA 4503]
MIDDTLYDAFGQRQVTQYFTQLNSYHVILEILPELQGKLDTLNKIYIKSPTTGDEVPLSVFCKWTTIPVRPLAIAHQGQFPATTISFNLAQGVALGQATDAIQNAVADLGAPATLSSSFQGTAQAFQQSLSSVPLLILAALVVVYLILGVLYESYIHPLTILSTLPSAGVGALAILMAFGFDFSLIALIGIILLIGIVKKNGIMMVDFAITAERDEHLSPRESIRKAALLRFRPIMMTTMAALLGGVPLMLGTGTGSEIRQPLGYAMVGGLIVSQALTLFTRVSLARPVLECAVELDGNEARRRCRTAREERRRIVRDEIGAKSQPRRCCAPSPRSYGERVGVRGLLSVFGDSRVCGDSPSPGTHLTMRSDLSPRAGRGEAEPVARLKINSSCASSSRTAMRPTRT